MKNATLGKVALTAAVVAGGAVFLVTSSASSAQHYMMVHELMKTDLSSWNGKELKVHGWVESGTIQEKVIDQETQRTFVLQREGKKIRVFNSGPKPDTFKDQSEVVATGHLVPAEKMKAVAARLGVTIEADLPYVVDSTELMAKCPSKYDGARVNLQPQTPQYK